MIYNKEKFFEGYRQHFGRRLKQRKVDALDLMINKANHTFTNMSIPQFAYILATAYHETGGKMLPVKEIRQRIRLTERQKEVRRLQDRYWFTGYYGRGLVQITHEKNYRVMGGILGIPLAKNPDLALRLDVAIDLLFYGSLIGKYTGRKLSDYISGGSRDYFNARRVINGTDQAANVAGYAMKFEEILIKSTI